MTDVSVFGNVAKVPQSKSILAPDARTRKRNAAEARFRLWGALAVTLGVLALVGLLASILSNGLSSFQQTYVTLDVFLDPAKLDKDGNRDPESIAKVSTFGYAPLIETALESAMAAKGITVDGMNAKAASELISKEAPASLRNHVIADPSQIGQTVSFDLLAAGRIDGYYKGRVTMESAALDRNTSPEQLQLADKLKDAGVLTTRFNWDFFTAPDASDTRPEASGLGVAITLAMYATGLPNPGLWGMMAAVFNFIPYIGAFTGLALVTIASIVSFDTISAAVWPPLAFATITLIEGQFLSPLLVGRRLELNVVAVFVAVAFWSWFWGLMGAFMAVPMLVTVKVFADHVDGLGALSEFLAARDDPAADAQEAQG